MVQGEFGDRLIIANHHEDDVFEIPWVVERSDLYIAGCIPHVRIDGKFAIRGAQNCSQAAAEYREAINQRLSETGGVTTIAIEGAYLIEADSVRVGARFTLLDPDTLSDTRAFLLMLVDDLYWAGSYYDQVTQGAYEEDVILLDPGDTATIDAVFARDPSWAANDIRCLAFAQRMSDSLEVHQVAWLDEISTHVEWDPAGSETKALRVGPNPLRSGAGPLTVSWSPPAALASQPAPPAELHDACGRCVCSLRMRQDSPSTWLGIWDGRDAAGRALPAGSYWLRVGQASCEGACTRILWLR